MKSAINAAAKSAAIAFTAAFLAACSTTGTEPQASEVPEIRPGILMGYLPLEPGLESVKFVPPAPEAGSARQQTDDRIAAELLQLRGTERWELAILDADLHFPAAAGTFSCALGSPISEELTPALYMLLRRTLADVGLATYSAKKAYRRERPFMVNDEPTCTPGDEEALRGDGSYPSGHTSVGWGWALILSQLVPQRSAQLMVRGRAFGESRNVCNVHWHSDVVAGRMVGAAAFAQLQNNDEFLAQLDAAREDIARVSQRGLPPSRDCEAEQRALSAWP